MMAGLLIRSNMTRGRVATYVVVALLVSFCLFYVLDIDGPSFLATSTTGTMAMEAAQADEIKHPSLDRALAILLAVLPRGAPGVNALGDRGTRPVRDLTSRAATRPDLSGNSAAIGPS